MIALFLIPAMLVYVFAGDLILHLFGKQYSAEGFTFLRILAISGIAVSACAVLGSFFRVTKDARWLILINGAYAVTIITLSYMLLSYELVGIGIAWLCGNVVAVIVSLFALRIARNTVYDDHVPEEEVLHF
jgi:Na+-driven multidrug efflux pump